MAGETNRGTTPASTIALAIKNILKDVHTMLPGEIVSFDHVTQLAEIQISIAKIVNEVTVLQVPKIINVPLVFPRAGGFSLTFPVAVGDGCIVWFAERSLDNWIRDGAGFKPNDIRFHNITDAIAFVGLNSQQNSITDFNNTSVELRNDAGDAFIQISPNKDITISTPGNIEADCAELTATVSGSVTLTSPTITLDGDVTITGKLDTTGISTAAEHTSGTVGLSTHTHSSGSQPDKPS